MELDFTVRYNMESFCFCSNLKVLADDLPGRTTDGQRTKRWWQRPPYLQMSVSLPFSFLPPDPMMLPAWLLASRLHTYSLPGWMFSLMMVTCWSLSGRVCSCQNPTTWPSSWATMPNLSQFFPMDIACGPPPRRPT